MNKNIVAVDRKQFEDKLESELHSRRSVLRSLLTVGCGLALPVTLIGCDSADSGRVSGPDKPDVPSNNTGTKPTAPAAAKPAAAGASPAPAMSKPVAPTTAASNAAVTSPSAADAGKLPQQVVQYQTQPKSGQQCDGCMHFIPESNTCKVVQGQIRPEGWCTLWAKI